MQESCYCGRAGEIGARRAVRDALECPGCGHLDHLSCLPEDARDHAFSEAKRGANGQQTPLSA